MKLLTYEDKQSPYGKLSTLSWKDWGNSFFGKKEFGYICMYGINYREVIQEKWNKRKMKRYEKIWEKRNENKFKI